MKMSGVMEIGTMAAKLFRVDGHTDRQTDMTKLKVAFRNFSNAATNKRSGNGQIPFH